MAATLQVRHAVRCVRCGDHIARADAVLVATGYYLCTRCEPQPEVHDARD